jgi:hypothetical protein
MCSAAKKGSQFMIEFPSQEFLLTLGSSCVTLMVGGYGAWKLIGKRAMNLLIEKDIVADADIGNPNFARHRVVHESLTILRSESGADRVQVGQFHNGGKFLDGSPMKKFSVSHESCAAGVSFEFQNFQAVQASIFCDLIDLVKKDMPLIYLTNALPEESSTKTYNKSKGIEAFSVLPLMKKELFIGFVKMEWTDLTSLPENENEHGNLFKDYRSYIQLELTKKG